MLDDIQLFTQGISSQAWVVAAQVFEYLTTDLKKFMDSTGKGPKSAPMPVMQVKVRPASGHPFATHGAGCEVARL